MKKYLNKYLLKIKPLLFVIAVAFFIFSTRVIAQTKIEYYEKLFGINFGLLVYEEKTDNSLEGSYISSSPDESYLILLSSSISGQKTLDTYLAKNKQIILICDSNYLTQRPFTFSCNSSVAASSQLENIGKFLKSYDSQNINLYVIPENLLVSPEERLNFSNYLKAFKRSDNARVASENIKIITNAQRKIEDIKSLLNTTTFEIFILASSIFILVSLSYALLKFLSKENKGRFNLTVLKKILIQIAEYFLSIRWIIIYVLIVFALLYVPLVVTLSLKDERVVSVGYFIAYSLDTFKISNFINYVNEGDYFRVIVFFYNFVFLIVLTTIFIPFLINMILKASSKISNAKMSREMSKYGVPLITIILIITASFFDTSQSYRFLAFIMVVLLFIIINNMKYKTFNYSYTFRERLVTLFVAIFIIGVGILVRVREYKIGPNYRKDDLINTTDTIVTLPYLKKLGEKELMNDFSTSFPEPIFVNQYLVYSPIYSSVENKSISNFTNTGAFYIQNGGIEDIVSSIYSNEKVSSILTSSTPSNFFRFENFENMPGQESARIQITFSCSRNNLDTDKVKSDYYYLSGAGKIENSNSVLLYFPGCLVVGKPETYTLEFNPPYIESKYFFMKLSGVLNGDLKDIKIIVSGKELKPTYYVSDDGYSVLVASGQRSLSETRITNYTFEDSYNLVFNMNPDQEGRSNISQPINELIKAGRLKDTFLIWSTRKYIPFLLNQ